MQVRYHCPNPNCVAIVEYEPLESSPESIDCPRCHQKHPLKVTESITQNGVVDVCAVCGGRELFIRKDFPQFVGLMVVIVAGIMSIYFFRTNFLLAYAVLAGAVAVDLLLYFVIGKLTSCYSCRAEYRNSKLNPAHEGFDLAVSEKY